MDDIGTYQIKVRGLMDENDLNAMSPVQMTVIWADAASMLFTVHTDQSGLVGLIRHLHERGLALLTVTCE